MAGGRQEREQKRVNMEIMRIRRRRRKIDGQRECICGNAGSAGGRAPRRRIWTSTRFFSSSSFLSFSLFSRTRLCTTRWTGRSSVNSARWSSSTRGTWERTRRQRISLTSTVSTVTNSFAWQPTWRSTWRNISCWWRNNPTNSISVRNLLTNWRLCLKIVCTHKNHWDDVYDYKGID